MRILLFVFLLGHHLIHAQTIPKFGSDSLVDVACWNIEWFGNTSNGPTNEQLQYDNVKKIITDSYIDVWGLCEVSDNTTYMNLISDLSAYDEILASFSQTQKTALLWKKDVFNLLSWQMVLTETQYNFDFAGRPPLEVVLTTKNNLITDTIYFYVIHLKAISDGESYERRKNASMHMKLFLDQNRKDKKVMVIGDWNDNVTFPTWSGATVSPFKNFVDDSANYFFVSKQLSDQGKKSYISSNGTMIDHQMINKSLFTFYKPSSSRVLDELSNIVSGYSNNTSDHYPVLSYYNFNRPSSVSVSETPAKEIHLSVFPNPASKYLTIQSSTTILEISVTDISGKTEKTFSLHENQFSFPTHDVHSAGIKILKITDVFGNTFYRKVSINK